MLSKLAIKKLLNRLRDDFARMSKEELEFVLGINRQIKTIIEHYLKSAQSNSAK